MCVYLGTHETAHEVVIELVGKAVADEFMNVVGRVVWVQRSDLALIGQDGMVLDHASCAAKCVNVPAFGDARIVRIGLYSAEARSVLLHEVVYV